MVTESPLLERSWLSRARLWQQSISQARRMAEPAATRVGRFQARLGAARTLDRPVFVLGCPRSGTTYLGDLLQASPAMSYYFEPPIFKYYVRLIEERRIPDLEARLVYQLGLRSLLFCAPGSGPRLVEKNPNHVFLAPWLAARFPTALFVVITRDGRDVALSLSEKDWHRRDSIGSGRREPSGYLYGPHAHFYIEEGRRQEFEATTDFHRCIWIWRRHQEVVESLATMIDPRRQHHLRYEDLVLEPESTLPLLLDFLEIEALDRIGVMQQATTGRTSSVGRWKEALGEEELAATRSEAGELLDVLGYA